AGENLSILAAQDSDYYLYDKKSKGSWGKKKTKRDEVTDIRNVGSEITSGGDLTLESGGDQLYQVAKLTSGNDLTIESGGGITFEGVKDLHDESHTKSNNDAFWTSSKGKGSTDETLRQTQMVAKGELSIKAVNGLKIDIKQVDQQTVSQTIDAMVQADPQLAWLKEAEKRGDVDWRQVKEIHESFKYSNSGLGPASQIIIAIALAAVMGPMMASFSTMAQAGAISVATKATVSTIDNRGNLGKVLKDVTSKDSVKGYAVAVATAGVADGLGYNPATASVKTAAIKAVADATIKTAVYGGSFKDNLVSAAAGTAASIGGAAVAGKIGELPLAEGGIAKIILHAGLGGLLAEAMGGDFRAGALAGGANEVLVGLLGDKLLPPNLIEGTPEYDRAKANLLALSQIVGVLGAAANDSDVGIAAAVAANATQYNWLSHREKRIADEARSACAAKGGDVKGCQLAITRKMEALDKERQYELKERARAIQLQSMQEGGWSLEDYNKALYDDYFASKGFDKSEITFDGYDPAKTLGYMLSERGIGAANALIKWPGEVLGGIVSTVTHPLDALTGAAQSVWSAAGSVAGWATSPIPAQGLERVGDQLLAQSEQQAGELIFDTVSGLITTTIGGVAVKWVGGKWVRAEGGVNATNGSIPNNLNPGSAFTDLETGALVDRNVIRPTLGIPRGEYSAVKPGPLADELAETFSGGVYKEVVLQNDTVLYRAGTAERELGQFFSQEKPGGVIQSRIDKAVLPVWPNGAKSPIDTSFAVKIPAGTTVYVGKVGTQEGFYVGGTEQIVVVKPWAIEGVKVLETEPLK
ncbi:DUF637 domain-containing protein, partial [Pseudomonas cichorii]|nr:DUF637 domain-containing protein [Pseudomonas cichorii]